MGAQTRAKTRFNLVALEEGDGGAESTAGQASISDRRRALLCELAGIDQAKLKILTYKYPPFFIVFISIFELVVYTYYNMRSEEALSMTGPVPFNSKLIYNPYRRYEIWRYLTYILIHAGYWHITFNVLIQLAVGIPLETVHKTVPIFIIYIGGTISGALGNSVADPHSYLAGASSGCYALIAAHLSNLILNWHDLRKDENPGFKLLTLLVFCSTDFGMAIYERHFTNQSIAWRISYGGHLAGFVSGLLLGLIYLKRARIRTWDQYLAQVCKLLFLFLTVS